MRLLGLTAAVARRVGTAAARPRLLAASAAAATFAAAVSHCEASSTQSGAGAAAEPVFSADEVATHNSLELRVWVTFSGSVYDVTDFVRFHPGGKHIMSAAGGPLEPLWAHWQVHLNNPVLKHLQPYRIGKLAPRDHMAAIFNVSDPYDSDPERDARLRVLGERPFDCETAYESLASDFFTPQQLFYVRNHLPVPAWTNDCTAEEGYSLRVEVGDGGEGAAHVFSLRDLREKLPQASLHATLQCTGNRCNELEPSAAGGIGQIGHARWQGVWLRDLINEAAKRAGVATEGLCGHLHAVGKDGYEVSIPLEKAVDPRGDALVAHSMNGEPLARDHGAPARLVVPGFVGARSVKWLQGLAIRGHQSGSVWQLRYYRVFPPWVRSIDQIDYADDAAPPVYNFPVQSAIVSPRDGTGTVQRDADGHVVVRGYAVSGGGQRIVSVRVSADEGLSWSEASLQRRPQSGTPVEAPACDGAPDEAMVQCGREWGWVLWEARVPVPAGQAEFVLCSKATDSSCNTQPEQAEHIYNLRGYMSNAWPRVRVRVQDAE